MNRLMKAATVAFTFGLGIGFGLCLVLRSEDEARPAELAGTTVVTRATGSRTIVVGPEQRRAASLSSTKTGTKVLSVAVGQRLSEMDGVIEGQCLDVAGRPLAGVSVSLTMAKPELGLSGDWAVRVEQRVRSSAAGRFQFLGLPDTVYSLNFTHDDFDGFEAGGVDLTALRPSLSLTVRATESLRELEDGKVKVKVLFSNGWEAHAAMVRFFRLDGTEDDEESTVTYWSAGADPELLPPGRYFVDALSREEDEDAPRAEGLEFELRGGELLAVTVTMKKRACIVCRVARADGVAEGSVELHIARDPFNDSKVLDMNGSFVDHLWLKDRSQLVFNHVTPGSYLVGVGRRRMGIECVRRVTVAAEPVFVDLVAAAPNPRDFVNVRVLGPNGQTLLTGVSFSVRRIIDGDEDHFTVPAQCNGRAWAVDASVQRVAGASYEIGVEHSDFGVQRLSYQPGGSAELRVRFDKPSSVTVKVLNPPGASFGSLSLGVGEHWEALTGQALTFSGVQPGTRELRVVLEGPQERVLVTRPLKVVAGESMTVPVRLPALHTVNVLSNLRGQHSIALRPEAGDSPFERDHGLIDKQGRVQFVMIPPGRYILDYEGQTQAFLVSGNETVNFQVEPEDD